MKYGVCKGNYRCDHFSGCLEQKQIYRYGLCQSCFRNWCKSTEAGADWVIKNTLPKVRREKKKTEKGHLKQLKISSTNWKTKLQVKVQKIARLIDYNQPCTARPGTTYGQAHGGHVFAKGGHPQCRLNLHNIHIQSAQSNNYFDDTSRMHDGIKRVYGENYFDFVEDLTRRSVIKEDNMFYKEKYDIALSIIGNMPDQQTYTKEERIHLRNEYNLLLGIYPKEDCVFAL